VAHVPGLGRVHQEIQQFFADFEEASRSMDWARYGEMFLPDFMSLDPESSGSVAREDLIAFLPHRKEIFDRAGATGTTLVTLETEALDPCHAVARTSWDVAFDHERELLGS
jgi:hypothetical protein